MKRNKRGASLEKDLQRGGFLNKKGKGQGAQHKCAFFFLPSWETEEGEMGGGGAWAGGLGARRQEGVGEKWRGGRGDLIPPLTMSWGGARRPGHGGQRRRGYKASGGGARGAKEELGRRRWLVVVDVVLGDAPRPLL